MSSHQQRLTAPYFLLALLMSGIATGFGQTVPIPAEAQQAANSVQAKAIEAHMRYLADDKLEGRKPGTRGYELAAQYVEGELKKLGYKPAGERGTYRQNVPLRSGQVDPKASSLMLTRNGIEQPLTYGKNYILNPNFDQPRSDVSAPVVFVGYGISAPELGYDDYAQIDVRGKIVAYFNGAPTIFPSNQRAYFGSAKAEIAAAHGAIGVVSFSLPTDVRARVEAAAPRIRQATYRWVDRQGKAQRTFPQIQATVLLSDSTARSLFVGTAKSFEEAVAVAHRSYPQAFPLNASIRIKTQTVLNEDLIGQNVIGLLPGSDPVLKNEYVVYVSHLDHLGIGPAVKGDSIYNGAHDNASGVAINLEAARLFAALPKAPRRSILFVGVTGEEMGLLGSDYFASNPTVPASKLVANLCLDMPFFFHPLLDIVPYGVEHSSMAQAVQSAAGFLGIRVRWGITFGKTSRFVAT
jgi:Zn-dependent M28 family amino/carboxypeptidase